MRGIKRVSHKGVSIGCVERMLPSMVARVCVCDE